MTEPEVSPSDLRFRFQTGKQLPASITISNPTLDRIAFKVKTTTPKKYVVRPSSGIVEARSTKNVEVLMQAQKEFPPDFNNCKDKFLVQTTPLSAGEDLTTETFKKDASKDIKIKVILEGPPAPPSPVPEVNEQEEETIKSEKEGSSNAQLPVAAASRGVAADDSLPPPSEARVLKSQLERVAAERDELKRKLESLNLQATLTTPTKTSTKASSSFSVNVYLIIVVAVLAFILGHFFKQT